jgi:hypothetical protein
MADPILILAGYLVLTPCSLGGELSKNLAQQVLVSPEQIARISNPPDSPKGCVKVSAPSGSSLFVRGTEEQIAEARKRAMEEICPALLCSPLP